MYHPVTERSEFYTMADVHKPPVLFTPSEELEKVAKLLVGGGDVRCWSLTPVSLSAPLSVSVAVAVALSRSKLTLVK